MEKTMLLRKLISSDETSLKIAIADFATDENNKIFNFAVGLDLSKSFDQILIELDKACMGADLPNGFVASSFLVAIDNSGKIVGRVSIRHELNDFLKIEGGHIGYAVIPSERNKGYDTKILEQSLAYAKKLGLDEVLLTTDEKNIASQKVIEKCNGKKQENSNAKPGKIFLYN